MNNICCNIFFVPVQTIFDHHTGASIDVKFSRCFVPPTCPGISIISTTFIISAKFDINADTILVVEICPHRPHLTFLTKDFIMARPAQHLVPDTSWAQRMAHPSVPGSATATAQPTEPRTGWSPLLVEPLESHKFATCLTQAVSPLTSAALS